MALAGVVLAGTGALGDPDHAIGLLVVGPFAAAASSSSSALAEPAGLVAGMPGFIPGRREERLQFVHSARPRFRLPLSLPGRAEESALRSSRAVADRPGR